MELAEAREQSDHELPDELFACISVDARLVYAAFEFAAMIAEAPDEAVEKRVTSLAGGVAASLRDCLIAYEKDAIEQGCFPPYGEALLANPDHYCYLDEPVDET